MKFSGAFKLSDTNRENSLYSSGLLQAFSRKSPTGHVLGFTIWFLSSLRALSKLSPTSLREVFGYFSRSPHELSERSSGFCKAVFKLSLTTPGDTFGNSPETRWAFTVHSFGSFWALSE